METSFSLKLDGKTAWIEMAGRLDAVQAPALQEKLKSLAGYELERLVFLAPDLEYISSAGLRVVIFAKQKIGVNAQLYLIGAQEAVKNVIKMSGLDTFMILQDEYK